LLIQDRHGFIDPGCRHAIIAFAADDLMDKATNRLFIINNQYLMSLQLIHYAPVD